MNRLLVVRLLFKERRRPFSCSETTARMLCSFYIYSLRLLLSKQ